MVSCHSGSSIQTAFFSASQRLRSFQQSLMAERYTPSHLDIFLPVCHPGTMPEPGDNTLVLIFLFLLSLFLAIIKIPLPAKQTTMACMVKVCFVSINVFFSFFSWFLKYYITLYSHTLHNRHSIPYCFTLLQALYSLPHASGLSMFVRSIYSLH